MTSKHGTKNVVLNIGLLFFAVFLAFIIFSIHLTATKVIAFGVIYAMVILYSWLLPWKGSSIYSGIICSILTLYVVSVSNDTSINHHYVGINTIISLIAIWITVSLVEIARRGFQELEKITDNLEEKVHQKTIALTESEQLYKFLYENANEMYVSIDPDNGTILKCNTTITKKLGYLRDELEGSPFLKIYDDNSKEKVKQLLSIFRKTGVLKNKELTLLSKTGKKINVLLNASAVKDTYGNILYSRLSLFDVTEIKNLEHKFGALLESAPDAMVIVNEKGEIDLMNKQLENIFGYSKEDLIGQKTEKLVHSRYRKNISNFFINPTFETNSIYQELMGKKKNGTEFPIEITLNLIQTFEGPLIIVAIRDISERKKIEKEQHRNNRLLKLKNEELEQFVYIASHDLQQPLQTVQDFTQLLHDKYKNQIDEESTAYFNFIFGANKRMKSLVTGLLNYGLIGRKEERKKINCNEVIDFVIADLSSALKKTNAIFNYEKLPSVYCYPTEFRLLFQNLISNALKFRKENVTPQIKIGATKKSEHWEFYVKDNGIGIAEKHKSKVFVIFQKLHAKEKFEGVGIGLAHCKKIVELHGGEIWFESEENTGTTFYFTIPIKI